MGVDEREIARPYGNPKKSAMMTVSTPVEMSIFTKHAVVPSVTYTLLDKSAAIPVGPLSVHFPGTAYVIGTLVVSPSVVTRRINPVFLSATKRTSTLFTSAAVIPMGWAKLATVPRPSAEPGLPRIPASVVTSPVAAVTLRTA